MGEPVLLEVERVELLLLLEGAFERVHVHVRDLIGGQVELGYVGVRQRQAVGRHSSQLIARQVDDGNLPAAMCADRRDVGKLAHVVALNLDK